MRQNEVVQDRETALRLLCAGTAAVHTCIARQVQAKPVARARRAKRYVPAQPVRLPEPSLRCCRCGVCRVCQDNARWERVFREKFADLEYYSGLRVSQRSPLADF